MALDNGPEKADTKKVTPPKTCEACGSDRILEGPYYSQRDWVCMDCGHREEAPQEIHYAQSDSEIREEKAELAMDKAQEVLSQQVTMEMMSDPAKMAEYLKSLQEVAGDLNKTEAPVGKKSRKQKNPAPEASVVEQSAEPSLERDLIWQSINVYQRRNASWQEVLKQARDEKEYRNANVLVFAHAHSFGEACTDSCKGV